MYGDDIWWFSFYDMDSSLGLDNTGYNKFDCNIETTQPGIYNCSTSRMWVKLMDWCKDDLFNQFKTIREGKYTYENICDYLINKQIDVIPQILYNKDMYNKYIAQGRQYLHMLHGNNKDHLKRWLYNRFQYVDSLFLQHNSPYTKQNMTIRSCAPKDAVPKLDAEGNVISPYTARFEIQTYSPQYVTVCWRKNTFETKRVDWNETVVFEYDMVNSQDNELIVYCANNLKSLGDVSCLNPTSIDIGAANRLIEFKCENSDKLVKADVSKNSYLKTLSFKNCSVMGSASGGSNVIDISKSTNLKELDIRGTMITSVLTDVNGGNIEKIYYPEGIQNITLANQTNLEVVGIPYINNEAKAKGLATVSITNCNNIKHLQYPYNEEEGLSLQALKYVQNLTIDNSLVDLNVMSFNGFDKLRAITLQNLPEMTNVNFTDLLDKDANRTLQNVTMANIPNINKVAFNVTSNDYKIGFADNAVIDLGDMQSVDTIESNASIIGAKTLIVPTSLKNLNIKHEFGDGRQSISNIWSNNAIHTTDGYEGIDLEDITLEKFDMSDFTHVMNGKNINLVPIDQNPNFNNTRDENYFMPEGSIDLSNYEGDMTGMFKGLDLEKFQVIMGNKLSQTDLTNLFEGAIIPEGMTDTVNDILNNFPVSTNWTNLFKNAVIPFDTVDINIPGPESYREMILAGMFYGTTVKTDIDILSNYIDISEMFKHCTEMVEYNNNWDDEYEQELITRECYFGSGGDLEFIPAEWGGYGFFENCTSEIVVEIPSNNYTLELMSLSANNLTSNGVINWGDKTIDYANMANAYSHTYKQAGTYTIKGHFTFGNGATPTMSMRNVLKKVNFIATDTKNLNNAFRGCAKLTTIKIGNLNPTNMTETFYGCKSLTSIDFTGVDTFDCIEMRNTFYECESLVELDLTMFNTRKVTTFYNCFSLCTGLERINLSTFDTESVESMYGMFNGCSALQELDLSTFVTTNVNTMSYMFQGCQSLAELVLDNFDTTNVTNMSYMFSRCSGLTKLDLSMFNTENVTNMYNMFYSCTGLTELLLTNFNTEKVEDMQSMFNRCQELKRLDLSSFVAPKVKTMMYMFNSCTKLEELIFGNINTEVLENMSYMFSGCSSLTSLDLTSFKVENVTTMYSAFINCGKLASINLTGWVTTNTENMQFMFSGCSALVELDLSTFVTTKVKTMKNMFINCSNLTSLDLTSFVTPALEDLYGMFYGCGQLTSILMPNFNTTNIKTFYGLFYGCKNLLSIDLSSFDTSNATNMSYMFHGCAALSSLNLSNFVTNKVTEMQYMFYECGMTELILTSFVTNLVTNMSYMFNNCNKMTNLDISSFDTSRVTNMQSMFNSMTSIQSLDLSNFDVSNVENMKTMFNNCSSLTSLNLSSFVTTKVKDMSYMFYMCTKLPIIDLSTFDMSSVETMESMFELCIANIDMSGKNTNKVKTVYKMFKSFGGTSINMSGCSLADSTNNQEFIYNALKLTDFVAPSNIKSSMDIRANNLTVDSLLSVINALDLVETSQELEIGATNIGKLSDEQILIATDKNWTIS